MASLVDATLARRFTPPLLRWNPPVIDTIPDMISNTSLDGCADCAAGVVGLDLAATLPALRVPSRVKVGTIGSVSFS